MIARFSGKIDLEPRSAMAKELWLKVAIGFAVSCVAMTSLAVTNPIATKNHDVTKTNITNLPPFKFNPLNIAKPNYQYQYHPHLAKHPADNLPSLDAGKGEYTPAEEKAMGELFMQQVLRSEKLLDDPVVQDYIQSLGKRLVRSSDYPRKNFKFFVLNNPTINAFAGPDGYIGVNSGLINAMATESELAAVMSHEVAHITQRHLQRGSENNAKMRLPALAALMLALALGSQDATLGSGMLKAGMAGIAQQQLRFSREFEEEADRVGVEILSQAQFDPNAMSKAFARIQEQEKYYPTFPVFLSTHPKSATRVADSKTSASHYKTTASANDLNFQLVRERSKIDSIANMNEKISFYARDAKKPGNDYQSIASRYGAALALIHAKKYSEAIVILEGLIHSREHEPLFYMAKAHALLQMNRLRDAIDVLTAAYQYNPDYLPVCYGLIEAYLRANDPNRAITLINNDMEKFNHAPVLYNELASAYGQKKLWLPARINTAAYYEKMGLLKQALIRYKLALSLAKPGTADRLKLDAKIKELQKAADNVTAIEVL